METPLATRLVEPAPGASLPRLRPLSLGEILDRALHIFRANFVSLLLLMLVFEAPIYGLSKALNHVLVLKAPVFVRPGAFQGHLPDAAQMAWLLGAVAVFFVGIVALYQLAVAGLTCGAARAFLGERIEPGKALREGMARSPQLLATLFLLTFWVLLLIVLSTVPGIALIAYGALGRSMVSLVLGSLLLVVLTCVVTFYVTLRYALVSEVVVLERLSFRSAARRSAQLMAGRTGKTVFDSCKLRLSILLAVNFCVTLSTSVVASLPTLLVYRAFGNSPFDPAHYDPTLVPLWAIVPVELVNVLVRSAVTPFGWLAVIVFYFDLRIRREGFDLELMASRVGLKR